MLTERCLEDLCEPRVLKRGRSLAEGGRSVFGRTVRYEGDTTHVSAQVASQTGSGDVYRVSFAADEENDHISEYYCTCPAAYSFDGMCKHAVALALDFCDHPDYYVGYKKGHKATSTSTIADYVRHAEAARPDETMPGSIDVICEITLDYGRWNLGLRVTDGESKYVVKNLMDFQQRVDGGEFFSYGKRLAFTHSLACFTDRSRPIVEFVCRVIRSRRDVIALLLRGFGSFRPGRTAELTDGELAEFFELMGDKTFSLDVLSSSMHIERVHVKNEDPHISLSLVSANDGFTIERDQRIWVIRGEKGLYVWPKGDVVYRCSPAFDACADFLEQVYASGKDRLFIANDDMGAFCAAALPAMESCLDVTLDPEVEAYRRVPCKLEFYFDRDKFLVTGEARATYGEQSFVVFPAQEADAQATFQRDERLEGCAVALMGVYFDEAGELSLGELETAGQLLFGGLTKFRELGDVFTTPPFDRLIHDDIPRVTMGVSLAGGLIDLTVSATDLPASELAALLSSYRKRRRFHKLRSGAFIDLQQAELAQLDRITADLGITSRELASGHVELPAYRAFYLNEEADLDRDRSFTRYIDHFHAVDEASYALPQQVEATLRPYQEEGFRWLSARVDAGFGGVLADEMGLGKTLQLITVLVDRADEAREVGPSLIVCPASLVYNWMAEIERFAPGLHAVAVVGTAAQRRGIRQQVFSGAAPCDVLVTSYDLARRDADEWAQRELYLCALDEAQYIKNPATLTTRAVKSINARHRFALTGTPMENRLSELWSIFDFLMPGLLGPYSRFRTRFEEPIVGGDEAAEARLRAVVGPFMLRRLKADVLQDLPDKLESTVYAEMPAEQRKLYAAHEQHLREELTRQREEAKERAKARMRGEEVSTVEVLAELTRLRQLCCDPRLVYEDYKGSSAKLDVIEELVAASVEGGEKVLVFSQFTSFLELIGERLAKAGYDYYSITGLTPKKKRLDLVECFNEDNVPVFLVSLKAGGTGLNLTGASVVIHADPWWNAAAQSQATDRAHRIGQTRVVNVERVVARGTIEERIVRLQETKRELADKVVGGSGVSLAGLTTEELYDLLADD